MERQGAGWAREGRGYARGAAGGAPRTSQRAPRRPRRGSDRTTRRARRAESALLLQGRLVVLAASRGRRVTQAVVTPPCLAAMLAACDATTEWPGFAFESAAAANRPGVEKAGQPRRALHKLNSIKGKIDPLRDDEDDGDGQPAGQMPGQRCARPPTRGAAVPQCHARPCV